MRVHSRVVIDIASGEVLEDESYEYTGPVASCDPVTATIGAVGGSVASGLIGAEASEDASHAASQSAANSIAEQQRQFDLVRGDTSAYRDVGQNALYQLAQLFGLPGRQQTTAYTPTTVPSVDAGMPISAAGQDSTNIPSILRRKRGISDGTMMRIPPGGSVQPTPVPQSPSVSSGIPVSAASSDPMSMLRSMPGYQFRLGEQEKAMERMQAARGYSLTPRAAKEVGRYASDYASGEFGNLVESLFRLSGLGGNAVNTSANAGANAAGNIGNAYMNAGNAQANAAINSGSAWNNAIQGGLNNYATLEMYNRMLRDRNMVTVGGG